MATQSPKTFIPISDPALQVFEPTVIQPPQGFGTANVTVVEQDQRSYTEYKVTNVTNNPGGNIEEVQFNNGTSFAGDSGLTYDAATDSLTVTGVVFAGEVWSDTLNYANGNPWTGVAGTSGYSGLNGTIGASGYSGLNGIASSSGYSGISGGTGSNGTSGYSGINGTSGYSGIAGPSTAINSTADASTTTLYPVMVGTTGSDQTPKSATSLVFNALTGALSPTVISVSQYTETMYAPVAGTSFTVVLTNGSVQRFTTNGSTTITLPAATSGKSYVVMVVYGGTDTVTFAGGTTIKWSGGTQPTSTSVAGKVDIYSFMCDTTVTYGRSGGSNF